MKDKWNALKEKWYAIKDTKGFRIFSTCVGLIAILGPSLFGIFHEKEEPTAMEEASMLMEDEVRMDAITSYVQRGVTVNGSTVEIYTSAHETGTDTGATGVVIEMTQDVVLVATVYDAVKGLESVGVLFFEADCAEGRVVAVEEAFNLAVLELSKDSIPADTEDIIVPELFQGTVKKGVSLYGYNRGASEDAYGKTVVVTDAKYEVTLANNEEIKCIEVQLEEDAQVLNRIFYTEDSQVVGISVPGVVKDGEAGYVYIVPIEVILQVAGASQGN